MKLFSYLYARLLNWSSHRYARYYLAGISFIESSFFPIPPDVMLISMGLAKPHFVWQYAFIATFFSVLGGCFGYLLGYFGMALIEPILLTSTHVASYLQIQKWFEDWGVWIIFLAGFSPIPYKLFTVTAGMMRMFFGPFVLASIIGRGARFFLLSALLKLFGERLEPYLRRWIDFIGWFIVLAAILFYVVTKLKGH